MSDAQLRQAAIDQRTGDRKVPRFAFEPLKLRTRNAENLTEPESRERMAALEGRTWLMGPPLFHCRKSSSGRSNRGRRGLEARPCAAESNLPELAAREAQRVRPSLATGWSFRHGDGLAANAGEGVHRNEFHAPRAGDLRRIAPPEGDEALVGDEGADSAPQGLLEVRLIAAMEPHEVARHDAEGTGAIPLGSGWNHPGICPWRGIRHLGLWSLTSARPGCRTIRGVSAVFEWHCPTYGCKGVIIAENEPQGGSEAVCQGPAGVPFCGRKMRWDAHAEVWRPITPFEGFR